MYPKRKILELIKENPKMQDQEIAVKRGVETKSISNQISKMLKKSGAKNRRELPAKIPPRPNPA